MGRKRGVRRQTRAVGIVVPVHDEEQFLPAALRAIEDAVVDVSQRGVATGIAVVLDACRDASADVVHEWRRHMAWCSPATLTLVTDCGARNVGAARARGCASLLDQWSLVDAREIWLASTDADSMVPREWLTAQVRAHNEGADLWTGRVRVSDWTSYDDDTQAKWTAQYEAEQYPIHGTNMGFNAMRYLEVGGFRPLPTGEDRDLCRRLVENGATWSCDDALRVLTSARRVARAPRGFSHALKIVDVDDACPGSP